MKCFDFILLHRGILMHAFSTPERMIIPMYYN